MPANPKLSLWKTKFIAYLMSLKDLDPGEERDRDALINKLHGLRNYQLPDFLTMVLASYLWKNGKIPLRLIPTEEEIEAWFSEEK